MNLLGDTADERVHEPLQLLLELTSATSAARDFDAALTGVMQRICTVAQWRYAESWLMRADGRLERGPAWHGSGTDLDAFRAAPPVGDTLALRACALRAPAWDDALAQEDRARAAAGHALFGGAVAIPLLADSEPVGVLTFYVPSSVSDHDPSVALVAVVAAQLGQWLRRKSAEDRVRASEERFRLLVEHVGDAVFMLDLEGRIETWTAAAERIFGFEASEIVGSLVDVLFTREAREQGAMRAQLREACDAERHEVDEPRVRRDGRAFWAHVVTCPIRDASGRVTGLAQIIGDLTQVRAGEEAQRRYALTLERSNRDLEGFAAMASHDLQEPLRKILAFGDRLRSRCAAQLDDAGRDYLDRIDEASRRMQRLIDDLLSYSRISGRAQPLRRVDLGAVVHGVLRDLEVRVAETGAVVAVGPLPTIAADPTQMRQVFQNLIGNALKFHRPKSALPALQISARALPGPQQLLRGEPLVRWEIVFEDNGIGFDPKHAERIFGMLQRLHSRTAYEGTGMGLAICRKIIEGHDGEISAHSAPGSGAKFVIVLPSFQAEKAD
jgi:PAS domain S-box-containing protein